MSGISSGMSSIMSALKTPTAANAVQAGTGIASAGSGLYNSYENQKYQNMVRSLSEDPKKMQAYAAGFTKPLAAGTTQGVNNQSQAYAAERGLATSPSAQQQIQNQAIAPYIQQQQSTGMEQAQNALKMGEGGQSNPASSFSALGGGLSSLMKLLQQGQGGGTTAALDPGYTQTSTGPVANASQINLDNSAAPSSSGLTMGNGGVPQFPQQQSPDVVPLTEYGYDPSNPWANGYNPNQGGQ